MNSPPVHTFSVYCRARYGRTIGKIPLETGHPCPNRDRGGCLYCRPLSFTPQSLRPGDSLDEQIRRGKKYLLSGRFTGYFGYFQQETPTSLATSRLLPLLTSVIADPECVGLIIAARPDCIADDLPAALADLVQSSGKECLIELGLQSIHARSLQQLNRNHGVHDFFSAVRRIKTQDSLRIGVHLILGIPGETEADMLASVETVCALGVHALKLHHLQVLKDTPLHSLHTKGLVPTFSLDGYLQLLLRLLPRIPWEVVLHRLWSSAHPHLLVAPRWHLHATELSQRLQASMAEQHIRQGQDVDSVESTR
ncbi:TIGR01212 family radical SAM protein [Desulfobulbus alkaliphilus]|uniref:TIGR01212 family radical SAM protein n=1 Tax=Desulfobulbus alkaliphilus TaxID=869814 RepID=UPI0019643577|nr:TIGR01212 family radical SAM protein [Desulfobulbus alkaliphilus]